MAANIGFTFPCAVSSDNRSPGTWLRVHGRCAQCSLLVLKSDWPCWHSTSLRTCTNSAASQQLSPGSQSPDWSLPGPLLTYRTKISLQLPWQPLWSTTFAATREKPAFDIFKTEDSIGFQPYNTDDLYKNTGVSQPTEVFHSKHICWQGEQHR